MEGNAYGVVEKVSSEVGGIASYAGGFLPAAQTATKPHPEQARRQNVTDEGAFVSKV